MGIFNQVGNKDWEGQFYHVNLRRAYDLLECLWHEEQVVRLTMIVMYFVLISRF